MPASENRTTPGGLRSTEVPLAEIEDLIAEIQGSPTEHEQTGAAEGVAAGPAPRPASGGRTRGPQPFDFRRPRTLSRDQVRALHIVGETFARQFTTVLSMSLRSVCQVSLGTTDHMSYDEYVRSSPNPTLLALISLDPLPGTALLQVPLQVSMGIVERLLGGSGESPQPQRALSDIESALVREVLDRVVHEISYAFESLSPTQAAVSHLESNPHFAQVAAPSDMMVVLGLEVRIGAVAGTSTLALPHAALQPALENVTSQSLFANRSGVDPREAAAALRTRLRSTSVDVAVQFQPVVLTSAQILSLQVGDVVPLRHDVCEPLAVTAEGSHVAYAVSGGKGRRLAAMIVDRDGDAAVRKDVR